MLDVKVGAEQVEIVPAGNLSFAQAEQAVGEFLAIVSKYSADAQRAGAFQVAQETAAVFALKTQRVARSMAKNR